jgi:hypothetical protein
VFAIFTFQVGMQYIPVEKTLFIIMVSQGHWQWQ